jgi:NADPH-dependent ferric siderophore reductase
LFDAAAGELAIDFVLHGHGSAAAWAERARPGDRAGVSGPGSGYDPDPAAPWFVIAGDESALPAMATIAEALPPGRTAHVVAEVPGPLDRIDLVSPARLITTWLERDGQPPGVLLEAELRAMHVPRGEGRFWVAGESAVVRRVRDHLVEDRGVPKERYVVRAYWKAG